MTSKLYFALAICLIFCSSSCITIKINDDGASTISESSTSKISPFDIKTVGTTMSYSTPEDISFQLIDATQIKATIAKNELTWVYLWGSWCKPCIEKLPTIVKIAQSNPGLNILMISEDYGVKTLQRILFENQFEGIPYILNTEKYGSKTGMKSQLLSDELLTDREHIIGFPQNYIFDKSGKLLLYKNGAIDNQQLTNLAITVK